MVAAPGLHCLPAAAGAALGYALGLPIDAAAPYLVAAAVLCLWRVFARAEDNAGQIVASAVGAVAFCAVRMAAALAGGEGLAAIALAAAQGMLIVGLARPWGPVRAGCAQRRAMHRRSGRPCAFCIWRRLCAGRPIRY